MYLHLHLRYQYFDAVLSGEKEEEYRLVTPFWRTKLHERVYEGLVLYRGYQAEAADTRLRLPWRGCYERELRHAHFGPDIVSVYAIRLS